MSQVSFETSAPSQSVICNPTKSTPSIQLLDDPDEGVYLHVREQLLAEALQFSLHCSNRGKPTHDVKNMNAAWMNWWMVCMVLTSTMD